MKTLENFVTNHLGENFSYKLITFKHAASGFKLKRKGIAIYQKNEGNTHEVLTFEPCDYTNYKWFVYGSFLRYHMNSYIDNRLSFHAKNINEAIKKIKEYTK